MRRHQLTLGAFSLFCSVIPSKGYAQDIFLRRPPDVAGQRQIPGFQAKGLSLGGFEVFPSASTGLGYNSNVFAVGDNRQGDAIGTLQGRLLVRRRSPSQGFQVTADITNQQFFDLNEQSNTQYLLSAGLSGAVTRGTTYFASARYNDRVAIRGTSENDVGVGGPLRLSTLGLQAGVQQAFGSFSAGLQIGYSQSNFGEIDTGVDIIAQNFRDNNTVTGSATLRYDVSERLSVLANGSLAHMSFDNTGSLFSRDSLTTVVTTGVSYNISELLTSEIRVGFRQTDFDDGSLTDFEGLAISADISWYPTPLVSVNISATQSVQTSAFSQISAITVTQYAAGVDYELLRNLNLDASIQFVTEDFENINQAADRIRGVFGASYLINDKWSFRLSGSLASRNLSSADVPGQEFSQRTAMFRLTYRV